MSKFRIFFAILVAVCGSLMLVATITALSDRREAGVPVAVEIPDTQLRQAFDACTAGDLEDDDHTLLFDGVGLYGSADDFADVACVLVSLDTPQSVINKMDRTNSLAGVVEADWGNIHASWTYHPDDGMSLILEES